CPSVVESATGQHIGGSPRPHVPARRATNTGASFDDAVKRIEASYLSRGLVDKVTQYDNATVASGSKTDELQYSYDDWGNVTSFNQDVDSGIGGSGRSALADVRILD